MGASITIAGERLIAQKQAAQQPLQVARFILAYMPGLDTTQPVDREAGLPPAEQIVYSVPLSRDGSAGPNGELTREGYLSPNQVVYSLLMGTNIGDFDFNWIGLETTDNVLLITAYVPRQQKRREVPPLQTGNNLTRNIVLEYDGAQSLTGIDVPAASWQFDFTAQFAAMNTQIAALQAELEKKVDAASWNPPQSVSLDGPVLVYPGSVNTYQITDFDAFAVYQASSTVGSVTLAGDVLTLDVPAEAPEGLATLEIRRNGAKANFKVPVGSAAIDQPMIISPTAGAPNVTFEPELAASQFVVYPAGYDSHLETRWQVARDAGFTDLVFDQQAVDSLTAISLAAAGVRLNPATRYYVRAQYHGEALVSGWSATVAFNTATVYVRAPAVISPMDGQENVSSRVFKGDAFSVYGGADTHAASRWQISMVQDFSTVLTDSGWSPTDLTSWAPVTALAPATEFFARVQYRGATVGDSQWSSAISFTTADPLAGVYTALATGPSTRTRHTMAALNGYIYVCGGDESNTVWRYDPSGDDWRQMASMPVVLGGAAAAVSGAKIYICGGRLNGANVFSSDLYCYTPESDTWSTLPAAPLALFNPSMHASNGSLYLFAGSTKMPTTTPPSKKLFRYDIESATWATLSDMPEGRGHFHSGLIDGRIFVASALYWEAQMVAYMYDPASDYWSEISLPLTGQSEGASAVVAGRLYIHGGTGEGNSDFGANWNLLQEYDPTIDTWRILPKSSRQQSSHAACELDGSMYIFGGYRPGNLRTNWFTRID